MDRLLRLTFVLLALALFSRPAWAEADPPRLDEATYKRLHAQLRPGKEDLWRTIPWNLSLLEAQRTAARDKKPIFIWAMDGHPLGCT